MFRYVSFGSLLQWSFSSVRRFAFVRRDTRKPRCDLHDSGSSGSGSPPSTRRILREDSCFFWCPRCVQDVSPPSPLKNYASLSLSFVFGLVFPNVFLPRFCLPRIARVTLATLPWAWWGVCGLRSHLGCAKSDSKLSPTLRPSPWKIIIVWLVVYLPLWKIWVRQLGWWNSQLNGTSFNSMVPVTTKQ